MSSTKIARVGVGVFIFKDSKFIMGKRKGSHGSDTWSIPGGHLEYGETFEDTAKREAIEETDLTVTNVRFAAVTNDYFPKEDKHYITIWVICDYKSGVAKLTEPDKFIEQSWQDFNSLPEPLFLPWHNLLKSEFMDNIKKELAKGKKSYTG